MSTFTYRDLNVWKQAIELVMECYRVTQGFPPSELYGLTSQLRRAAVSIPANIAEGQSRRITKVYLNHLSIALGSQGELETCLEIAGRLGFLPSTEKASLVHTCESVGRLLNALHRSLQMKIRRDSRS